jgi:hypothetical protein
MNSEKRISVLKITSGKLPLRKLIEESFGKQIIENNKKEIT